MAANEKTLPSSLQEAVVAVLAFDAVNGAVISATMKPEYFDGIYNEIASPVLAYRARYGKPPGREHLESLFPSNKLDPSDRRTNALRQTLASLAATADKVNGAYVTTKATDFARRQVLKSAVLRASDRFGADEEKALTDVEQILTEALRFRTVAMDAGIRLDDPKALSFLNRDSIDVVPLGIPDIDQQDIGPVPGELLLYIAPKNSGKSWFAVHCGRQALIHRKRVLHITLEMGEERVIPRYYSSFFGIARRRDETIIRARLEADEIGRLVSIDRSTIRPDLAYNDPNIRKALNSRIKKWGARFGRLVVKAFPTKTLTISGLTGYLDYLESVEDFVPDVIIVDYPDLMAQDIRYLRSSIGQTYEHLRGVAIERKAAIVAPTQGNRSSLNAKTLHADMVAEDISKVNTADNVLLYSQTKGERKLGLARLSLTYARNAERDVNVILSQAYPIGQYVTGSARLTSDYFSQVRDMTGGSGDDD